MTSKRRVDVFCTDKGQHAWTQLGDLMIDDHDLPHANITAVYGEHADSRKDECVRLDEYNRAHFWCPRCSRAPQLSHARLVQLVAQFADNGVSQLDISHLP